MGHLSVEIRGPALDRAGIGIHPVEAGLGVAVLSFDGTEIYLKENMPAVIAPVNGLFDGFIVGQLVRRLIAWKQG